MRPRALWLLLCAALAACGDSSAPITPPAAGTKSAAPPTAAVPALLPTNFGASTYFTQHCARCHGPEGQFWGERYGRNLTPAQLLDKIRMMAAGPGGAPLNDPQLTTLTTFLQTIIAHEPYAEVVSVQRQSAAVTITGEAGNDVTIHLEANGITYPTVITDNAWTAQLPAADTKTIALTATKAQQQTTTRWTLDESH